MFVQGMSYHEPILKYSSFETKNNFNNGKNCRISHIA